jgi:Right handed beta helix region
LPRTHLIALLCVAGLAVSGCAVSSTGPVVRVSNTQAAIQGVIASTVGGTGSYWVEYGTDTTYGDETTHRQAGFFPGGEARSVDVTLTDLAPETVYHYRLCSKDGEAGSPAGCSKDRSFRTGLACGTVVTQDTRLSADMDCESGSVLVIGAAGITVDLAGHSLRGGDPLGAGWLGIDNTGGHEGVTVKNGTVRYDETPNGPGAAIVFEDASEGLLQNLEIQGNVQLGGDHTRLSGTRVRGFAGTSVQIEGHDNQVLHADLGSSEGTALELTGARNRVADSAATGSAAVEVSGADAVVVRNHIFGGPGTGLTVTGAGHRVIDNDLSAVFGWGLSVSGGTSVVARDNRVSGGFDTDAVMIESSSGTNLRANDVTGTSPDGIHVAASATGTLLRLNTVHGLRDDGIDVDSAATSLGSNSATENGDLGIEAITGVTDLGGNLGARNGNPLQCQNVFCQ